MRPFWINIPRLLMHEFWTFVVDVLTPIEKFSTFSNVMPGVFVLMSGEFYKLRTVKSSAWLWKETHFLFVGLSDLEGITGFCNF